MVLSRILDGGFSESVCCQMTIIQVKCPKQALSYRMLLDSPMILIRENEHKPMILDIRNRSMLKLSVNSSLGFMDAKVNIEKSGN